MTIKTGYLGEDLPVGITYVDSADAAIDPDDQGTSDFAFITITEVSPDTEHVSAVSMTKNDVGDFEYVWDTGTDAGSTGEYEIEINADFSAETKIARTTLELR